MKILAKNETKKQAQRPIAAPIVLTPDQIALIAAGMPSSSGHTETTGHVVPPPRLVAM
jgi:hypothetical protein